MLVLFAMLYALGDADHALDASLLFVVPISLSAVEFGVPGGLIAGLFALVLVLTWDLSQAHSHLTAIAYLSRAVAFLFLGGLLGRFVTARRVLEDKIVRSEELSLDLMATAGFDGYFKRLNRSWERTLGWSVEELYSRPLVEFVHPADRERTEAEIARVADGTNSISFRNRYRARDGSYRWLEWNARVDTEQALIHANARDITVLEHAEEAIRLHGDELERIVDERTGELRQSRTETLRRLALAAEYRDDATHQHTERVGHTSMLIARELGLPQTTIQTIRDAGPLHDVGKLGIPDAILLKPGPLTPRESYTMRTHTQIGAAILANSTSLVLQSAAEIARSHHERWDGTGYPDGLSGNDIPLSARIVAVADTFDAITHNRPYRNAAPVATALMEIRRTSGTQFDPAVVHAFRRLDHNALVHALGPSGRGHVLEGHARPAD